MNKTPQSIIDDMNKLRRCARYKEGCEGRLTIEHAFGRTRQERWQCIWLCEKHHGLGEWANKKHFDKEKNKYYAYLQTTDDHLMTYKTGAQWVQERKYLIEKFGKPSWWTTATKEERSKTMAERGKQSWAKITPEERSKKMKSLRKLQSG